MNPQINQPAPPVSIRPENQKRIYVKHGLNECLNNKNRSLSPSSSSSSKKSIRFQRSFRRCDWGAWKHRCHLLSIHNQPRVALIVHATQQQPVRRHQPIGIWLIRNFIIQIWWLSACLPNETLIWFVIIGNLLRRKLVVWLKMAE